MAKGEIKEVGSGGGGGSKMPTALPPHSWTQKTSIQRNQHLLSTYCVLDLCEQKPQ